MGAANPDLVHVPVRHERNSNLRQDLDAPVFDQPTTARSGPLSCWRVMNHQTCINLNAWGIKSHHSLCVAGTYKSFSTVVARRRLNDCAPLRLTRPRRMLSTPFINLHGSPHLGFITFELFSFEFGSLCWVFIGVQCWCMAEKGITANRAKRFHLVLERKIDFRP